MYSALQWELRFRVLPLWLKNIFTFEDGVRHVEQFGLEPTSTPYKDPALYAQILSEHSWDLHSSLCPETFLACNLHSGAHVQSTSLPGPEASFCLTYCPATGSQRSDTIESIIIFTKSNLEVEFTDHLTFLTQDRQNATIQKTQPWHKLGTKKSLP